MRRNRQPAGARAASPRRDRLGVTAQSIPPGRSLLLVGVHRYQSFKSVKINPVSGLPLTTRHEGPSRLSRARELKPTKYCARPRGAHRTGSMRLSFLAVDFLQPPILSQGSIGTGPNIDRP